MKVIRVLDLDLYRPQGIINGDRALLERIPYFERTLSGNARSQFNKFYEQARKKSLNKWNVKDTDPDQYQWLIKDRTEFSVFSVWTLEDEELSPEEDKKQIADEQIVLTAEQLVMGHQSAQMFQKKLL